MHTTWAAWQAALYFDGRTDWGSGGRKARRGNGNKKNEGKWVSKWREMKKEGMREDQLRLTLGLLHEHDFGFGQEVMAAEEHPFTSWCWVAVQTLLLHQRQLLCRALGYRRTDTSHQDVSGPSKPDLHLSLSIQILLLQDLYFYLFRC